MGHSRTYYALLSGEHPRLALEELKAILDVEARSYRLLLALDGLAVFEAEGLDPRAPAARGGLVRESGVFLALTETRLSCVRRASEEAAAMLPSPGPWRVEARVYGPHGHGLRKSEVLRAALDGFEAGGAFLSPRARRALRVFVTEGVAMLGVVEGVSDTRGFLERSPGKRPFFKPGPLSPHISRAMVNLSRLRPGGVYADPFCGTGGFAIEACLLGASKVLCGDVDWVMAQGSALNLSEYCPRGLWASAVWNAARLPLAPGSVDSIATDPPYGRSTSTRRIGYRRLVMEFLKAAREAVRSGGYIVYAGPAERDPRGLALEAGLEVESYLEMYVHGSLTRGVVVARTW